MISDPNPLQLTAKNLTTRRGGRAIFKDLSFQLAGGEALVLTGANGAGKTTLIRTIAGYLPLSGGTIELTGGLDDTPLTEQCHYIGHKNAIKTSLSVEENLTFWAGFLANTPGTPATEKSATESAPNVADASGPTAAQTVSSIGDALAQFNLTALRHIPGGYLSAGQTRRLGLARLLVAHRPLWLLDEPTVSLDTLSQQILSAAVNAHVKAGGMVLAATHIPLGLTDARELRLGAAGGGGGGGGGGNISGPKDGPDEGAAT